MKIVINVCYGGFSLSPLAVKEYGKAKGFNIIQIQNTRDVNGKRNWDQYVEVTDEEDMFDCFITCPLSPEGTFPEEAVFSARPDSRSDPLLIEIVERLGEAANGAYAKLKVIEIPDDVKWKIEEYDGIEHVREISRTWR
jgi:hypothetical protein